jgi:hypothetical protein
MNKDTRKDRRKTSDNTRDELYITAIIVSMAIFVPNHTVCVCVFEVWKKKTPCGTDSPGKGLWRAGHLLYTPSTPWFERTEMEPT